jgi:hypothetical protein
LGVDSFAYNIIHDWYIFGACLEVVWRLKHRTFYIGSLRVKLILECLEVLKRVWLSMNRSRLLFIEIQTLPLSRHHKWIEIVNIVCRITNGKS